MPKVFTKQTLADTGTLILSEIAPANCSEAHIQVEAAGDGIRYRKDKVLPSATVGILAEDGETIIIPGSSVNDTNIIARSATDLHIHFTTANIVTL